LQWGREGKRPFVAFLHDVEEALAYSEASDLKVIDRAAQNDPKWAAWRLERRHRDRWAPRREQQDATRSDQPIRIQLEWGQKPEAIENEAQRGIESGAVEDAEVVDSDVPTSDV
jgi:hypothetical protein